MLKSGFISIVGSPNAGKSTLLNKILKKKVSIVTDTVQTTRDIIKGIYHEKDLQIVFLDTPGFHKPNNKLQKYMNFQIDEALYDIEGIIYILDASIGIRKKEEEIISRLRDINLPIICIINKIDLIDQDKLNLLFTKLEEQNIFKTIIPMSLKEDFNTEVVIDVLKDILPQGVKYYEDDQFTDSPQEFVISEIIREKIILKTREEIPHSIGVKVLKIEDSPKDIYIEVVIFVERESQKGILIGKKASMIKSIGIDSRKELELMYNKKVILDSRVKVLKNWGRKEDLLKEVGYDI